jgi:coenzyme PQQ precursor peptide PqqA
VWKKGGRISDLRFEIADFSAIWFIATAGCIRVCRILHVLLPSDAEIQRRFGGFIFQESIASASGFGYSYLDNYGLIRPSGGFMEWTTPAFEEVCLNCEINSYASAKL